MDLSKYNGIWQVGSSHDTADGIAGDYLPTSAEQLESVSFSKMRIIAIQRFQENFGAVSSVGSVTPFNHETLPNGVDIIWGTFQGDGGNNGQIRHLEISILPTYEPGTPLVIDHYLIFANDQGYPADLRNTLKEQMTREELHAIYLEATSYTPTEEEITKGIFLKTPFWQWKNPDFEQ